MDKSEVSELLLNIFDRIRVIIVQYSMKKLVVLLLVVAGLAFVAEPTARAGVHFVFGLPIPVPVFYGPGYYGGPYYGGYGYYPGYGYYYGGPYWRHRYFYGYYGRGFRGGRFHGHWHH
jgi:hypothetical protein